MSYNYTIDIFVFYDWRKSQIISAIISIYMLNLFLMQRNNHNIVSNSKCGFISILCRMLKGKLCEFL